MLMERDIAAMAGVDQPVPEGDGGETVSVSAEFFRRLTERLKVRKALPPPEPVPMPEPEPVAEAELPPADMALPIETALAIPLPPAEVLQPRRPREPGEEAGDTAITLLELMATATGLLPQERNLAADALLLLLPRMPARQLIRLSERVAIMDNPPPLLLARLIRDPRPEVMGPVLERSAQICDREMIEATAGFDVERLRMIARRRVISPLLSSHLVASGDPEVILALLRNAGAELPHQAFATLSALAVANPVLLAPLATRADLPAATAFELYWSLPSELRRLITSRFLTDSGTLGRILRIALAEDASLQGGALREERPATGEMLDSAIEAAAELQRETAAFRFAALAGIAEETVLRILLDRQGEPLAALFKALGVSRTRFLETLEKLRGEGKLLELRDNDHLQAVFEGLSFTKARMLIIYWDWFTRKTGPYAAEG